MGDRIAAGFLRHPDARRLWYGSAASSVAVWMLQVGVAVQVLASHSAAVLASVMLVGTLPALVVMPLAGVCADRFNPRRLGLATIAGQVACTGLLAGFGRFGPPVLAALYALQGALAAFWPPARQQWLYGVIDPQVRQRANAAIGSINGIMTLIGAAAGGALSAWHPAAALGVAAAVQCGGFLVLLRVRRAPVPEPGGHGSVVRAVTREMADGVGVVRRFPLAGSVVWIGIAWGFIGGGYTVLLSGHVIADLHGNGRTLGLVYLADGLSVIIATWLAGRVPRRGHLVGYAVAYIVQGFGWALTFAADGLVFTVAALVTMRSASGFIIALDTTILLDTVPGRFRGRVASLHMTTYTAVARVALAVLSGVLTVVSIRTVGVVTGLMSATFGVIWWWLSGRPARREYLAGPATEPGRLG